MSDLSDFKRLEHEPLVARLEARALEAEAERDEIDAVRDELSGKCSTHPNATTVTVTAQAGEDLHDLSRLLEPGSQAEALCNRALAGLDRSGADWLERDSDG